MHDASSHVIVWNIYIYLLGAFNPLELLDSENLIVYWIIQGAFAGNSLLKACALLGLVEVNASDTLCTLKISRNKCFRHANKKNKNRKTRHLTQISQCSYLSYRVGHITNICIWAFSLNIVSISWQLKF